MSFLNVILNYTRNPLYVGVCLDMRRYLR